MRAWDTFEHNDAYDDLKAIVHLAASMGGQPSSCGKRKITIKWPDGGIVHIRRFLHGKFRWLIFTQAGWEAVLITDRDPSMQELQGIRADSFHAAPSGKLESALAEMAYPGEALTVAC